MCITCNIFLFWLVYSCIQMRAHTGVYVYYIYMFYISCFFLHLSPVLFLLTARLFFWYHNIHTHTHQGGAVWSSTQVGFSGCARWHSQTHLNCCSQVCVPRFVCWSFDSSMSIYQHTSLLEGRTVTTAHYDVRPYCVCLSSSFHLPICLTKLFLGFVFMCATTERASENFPKWAMERRSVTRPTAVWRPSGMLLSPWLPLSGHAFLILKWLSLQGHACWSRPSGPRVSQVCMALYIFLHTSLPLMGYAPICVCLCVFVCMALYML